MELTGLGSRVAVAEWESGTSGCRLSHRGPAHSRESYDQHGQVLRTLGSGSPHEPLAVCVKVTAQMQTGLALTQVSVILPGPTRQNCLLNGRKWELNDLGTEMQEKGPQSRRKHWDSFFLPSFRKAAAWLTFLLKTHVYRLHKLSSSLCF